MYECTVCVCVCVRACVRVCVWSDVVPNRVSDADGAAVDVDLAGVEAEFACVSDGDDTESLVDLPQRNVLHAEPRTLQHLGNCQRRRHGEIHRPCRRIRKRCNNPLSLLTIRERQQRSMLLLNITEQKWANLQTK